MSGWDHEAILRDAAAAVEARFADAPREALIAEIAALRAAAHPFVATFGGLDMAAARGVSATSKLFPARIGKGADRDRLAVFDPGSVAFRFEPARAEGLHLVDYEEAESVEILNPRGAPPALDDAVAVLRVSWEGIGGGGPAGEVSMADVRRLVRQVADP